MLRPTFLVLTTGLLLCACADDETAPTNVPSTTGPGSGGSATGGDATGGDTGGGGASTGGRTGGGGAGGAGGAMGGGGSGGTGPCSGQCDADEVCVDDMCLASCSPSDPCDAGFACHDGACQPIVCGDSLVEGDEACDDGPANADDAACTSACVDAVCGDGLVWSGVEECDDGNMTLDDACPDGPGGTCELDLPPAPATGLAWQPSSPANTTTPTAMWTPSTSTSAVSQEFQLFSGDSCATSIGAPLTTATTSTASQPVALAGEGTYTFQITTHDSDGDQTSACSPPMIVDMTPPAPATNLGYLETSPHGSLTVHGTWALSVSPDVGAQSIQLYGGGICTVALGMPVNVGSATATQYPIVTPSNATYSYRVITADLAGNTAISACSPPMQTQAGAPYVAVFNGDFTQHITQARIDPNDATMMYVTTASGGIYKSADSGATWTLQCTSASLADWGGDYGHIRVSPGPDGTAYAASHVQFVRAEDLGGAECPQAFSGNAAWASYFHSNRLAIDSTGKVYTWTFTSPGGLVSSVDQGASFTPLNTTQALFNSMQVDPFDDAHLVAVFDQNGTSPQGIHHSLNAGVTWTPLDTTFEGYQQGVIFNPAAQGWIHLEGGRYSQNGGLTWATGAAYDVLEIDATGAGYRFTTGASGVTLVRAPSMTTPAWSTLHTFTGVSADLDRSMVSVVGSRIAVTLEGRLFVSTNSGSTFTEAEIIQTDTTLMASSIVANGPTLYAAANGRILKSSDAAQTWAEVYAPSSPLDPATELHLNPGAPAQLVARVEDWNSTYEERLDVTLDGGLSWSTPSDCCYSWAGVMALGPTDPSRVYYIGWEPRVSFDGGLTFTPSSSSGPLVWDPWPQAFISPTDSDIVYYGDGGDLLQYDYVTDDETDITNKLPFSTAAGIDVIEVAGVWHIRVISPTGQIAISTNSGATYSLVPGSGGLPSASRRIFVSHPGDPNLIATAPLLGGAVAYSPTLGASWVQTTLMNCEIRGLALTDGQLFIPCENDPTMAIAAP